MTMTPRERVLAALQHEEPDRVPIVLGPSNATGIKMTPYRELKQRLGIDAPDEYLYRWPELGTAAIDEETLVRLGTDVRGVLDVEPARVLERNAARPPGTDYINSWGSGASQIAPDEWFPTVCPLASATTIAELDDYPWPDMDDPTRVAHVADEAARLAEEHRYAILATPWLLFPFERACAMQGMDVFLANPDLLSGLRRGAPLEDRGALQGADGALPGRARRPRRHHQGRRRPRHPGQPDDVAGDVSPDPEAGPRRLPPVPSGSGPPRRSSSIRTATCSR